MHDLKRRRLLGGMLFGTGAAIVTVPAAAKLPADFYVPQAPPPPRREAIPVPPAERATVESWQPGDWRWNGAEHIWTEGHYVARPSPGAEWIAGRWEQRPRGWVYVEGHWN